MAGNVAVNDQGQVIVFGAQGWAPAPIAEDGRGNRVFYDGAAWQPVPGAAPQRSALGWAPTAVAQGFGDLIGFPRAIGDISRSVTASALDEFERQGVPMLDGQQPRAAMAADLRATTARPGVLPTPERATAAMLRTAGITPTEPETTAGRVGAEAVRFAAGSALGLTLPGLLRNIGFGGIAGTTSGAAGEATRGTAAEGPARIAGALAPAAVASLPAVVRGNPVRDAAQALEGLTAADMAAAQRIMRDAEAMGSPVTMAEAVQQVTGGNRNLRAAQDLAQNTVGGQRVMNLFLDARDAGARRALDQFAERFAPIGDDAAMIPTRIQEAALAEVAAAYAARSQAVAPLYAQAAADAAQPGVRGAVRGIVFNAMSRLEAAGARDQSGILGPQFEQMAARFRAPFDASNPQPVDWESINDARRFLRDTLRQQGAPGQPVIDRKVAGQGLRILEEMTDRLKAAVPSLRAADSEYIRLTREVVTPVERGIIGRVGATDSAQGQRALLFPRQPMAGEVPTTPQAAGDAFGAIAGPLAQRRNVATTSLDDARGLLGVELRARLDEAFAMRASGPAERAGAAAATRIAPTQGREDALLAAFHQLPGGDQAAAGFARMMDVLQAQSFAPPRNSSTAARSEAAQRAGGGIRAATNPVAEGQRVIQDWSRNANTESLARALTTPEGFNMLRAMAGIESREGVERIVSRLLTLDRTRRAAEDR